MKKYVIAFLFTFASVLVLAQVPGTLSYQGILLDVNGVPVADNTAGYQVTFFFYNVETGGTALEVRGPFTVNTKKGLFTVILGDGTSGNAALPASFGDQQIWMSIKVDADAELLPRVKFTSVPYAYRAENANKATLAAGVEAGKVVQSINSLKDAVTISGSSGVTVNSTGNNIDIAGPSSIVNSLNSKTGSVTISAGSNITLTPSGNDLQISAPANLVNKVNNISGDVTIAAGANVTVNNAGNTVTINATASGGNVSGTGTAGYVSFWDGLSSIASNSNLYWDNTNSRLGVGTGTPSVRLDVNGTANATAFTGDGSGLTALNAGNISSGTLADARLESTVDITSGLNVGTSKFSVDGNGNITKLNNITTSFPSLQGGTNSFLSNNGSGTLSWASSLAGSQVGSGINAGNITTGTLSGSLVGTGVNASNITSGTLAGSLVGTGVNAANISGTATLSALNVGGSSQFTINSAGDITKINNIATSFPFAQGAANSFLSNNGSGTLSWTTTLAGSQVGSGINASNITTGTLSGSLIGSGVSAANLTGSNNLPSSVLDADIADLADGTLNLSGFLTTAGGVHVGGTSDPGADNLVVDGNASVSGTISGSGSGITNLNATNITSGTMADARLETNVDVAGSLTTVNGLHVGGSSAPATDNLEVDGFTKMGSAVNTPAIKMLKLTGTTSGSASGTVGINHGLTSSKVLSVTVLVEYTTGNFIPGHFIVSAGYYFNWYVTPTQVVVANVDVASPPFSSTNVRSKNFVILITYEQ